MPARTFFVAGVAMVALCVLSAIILVADGGRQRFSKEVLVFDTRYQGTVLASFNGSTEMVKSNSLPTLGVHADLSRTDFVVWGDSHARMMGETLDQFAREHRLAGLIAVRPGTAPLLDFGDDAKREWNSEVLDLIRHRQSANVILIARWGLYFDLDSAHARSALTTTVAEIQSCGARVWLLQQVPIPPSDPNPSCFKAAWWKLDFPRGITKDNWVSQQRSFDLVVGDLLSQNVRIVYLPASCFDASGHSRLADLDGCFYWDDNHLSPHGVQVLMSPALAEVFQEIAGPYPPAVLGDRAVPGR